MTTPSPSVAPDLDPGSLRRRVLALALPALGEQLLNFCVGLFDTFLAGRVHAPGVETGVSTSAVGIASYLSWLGTLMFALVGTGTMVLVARSWGAGEHRAANRFANCGMALGTVAGVLVFALLYFLAPTYARMQNLSGDSFNIVVSFLRTDAIGQLFYGFCLIGASALRGAGDMRSPMIILGIVNLFNIAASTTFVYGAGPIPPQGIQGIVYGTLCARIVGGLLMIAWMAKGISGLHLRLDLLKPHQADVRRILKIGLPAAADGAGMWLGHSLFLMIVSRLGTAEMGKANLAAHIIGVQVEALTYLPATAWGYAAATLVGQSLGAGKPEQARRTGHEAVVQCAVLAAVAAIIYLVFAPQIYGVMTSEPLVRQVGVPALRFLSWYQIPLAILIVYLHALRGAGDTRSAMWINAFGLALIRIPVAWLCGLYLGWGLIGAWSGMTLDVSVRAVITWFRYVHGQWMKVDV